MKTPLILKDRRGYALVLVLSFVVLVTSMLVAFLLTATTERAASGGFAASVTARQLGDTAIAMVQGQINDASTQGPKVAWVSQPGMVRTFDDKGKLVNAYKLYSGAKMVANSVNLSDDEAPAGWNDSPAEWTDINAPVSSDDPANPGALIKHFPIVDPAALEGDGNIAGLGPSQAKGFELRPDPPGKTGYQPLPMPVRWLYVLQDGKLVSPSAYNGKAATITEETDNNPIVGRVAFWTDDETAKVNINTASEGSYWDVPRAYTNTEVYELALKQPAFGEYNRFPGHPASVSLSAVLPLEPLLSPLSPNPTPGIRGARIDALSSRIDQYLQLTPRIRFGGSKGGTVKVNPAGSSNPLLTAVAPKAERLYASLDEMVFKPERTENQLVTEKVLESRRFFLTAHSRAPETNLFNLPRIASWPIYRLGASNMLDVTRTNAFDRTIALCASVGKPDTSAFQPYFFQRADQSSPTADYDGIPRNQELFKYLQELTGRDFPGFGGNLRNKYGADRDSILTQMFDYIRCTNLYDDLLATNKQFTNNYNAPSAQRTFGSSVAPIRIGDNQGQGRYYGLSQLAIVFMCNADGSAGIKGVDPNSTAEAYISNDPALNKMLAEPFPNGPLVPLTPTQKRVQALIVPTCFSTMIGWQLMRSYMHIEIDGLDTLKLEGQSLGFPATGWNQYDAAPHAFSGSSGAGGNMNEAMHFYEKTVPFPSSMPLASGANLYPFISKPITVPSSGMTFNGGGPITVRLYFGIGASKKLIQTATVRFEAPTGTIPTPTLKTETTGSPPVPSVRRWSFFSQSAGIPLDQGRMRVGNGGGWNTVMALDPNNSARDVARSMVVKEGDMRVSSAKTVLEETDFQQHPYYNSTTIARAIMLWRNVSADHSLITGAVAQNWLALPGLKPADNSGDFDNGVATMHDVGAPGANKPDEGQIIRNSRDPSDNPVDEGYAIPYYVSWNSQGLANATYFSPNRIMPSPVMFGSLHTGVKAGVNWRTLRFRPPASYETVHLGLDAGYPRAKDHLFLDLFWMPAVEPYAISDRLSTAGKINMNYQIMPFTYIHRDAPLRAVLKSEKVARIPTTAPAANFSPNINSSGGPAPPAALDWRVDLDVDQTLEQFTDRFAQSDKDTNVFISASEICDLHMVPVGQSLTTMAASWFNYRLTGDNMREKIYATVYPKLTTKSNTYTVHFRAQALKKALGSKVGTWTEVRDQVIGEYRGSTTLERFINPNAEIPDFARTPSANDTLDSYYKWRVISNKQFAP
jgi:uncharacterized protein (TIGR02600 family)